MLAADDLVDLGETLRRAEFRIVTQQLLAARRLLLGLIAEGALPSTRTALESLLGPIFCTSAHEQRKFDAVFRSWVRQRFPDEPLPEQERVARPVEKQPEVSWWRWAWVAPGVIALLVVAWFLLAPRLAPVQNTPGPPDVTGSSNPGTPLPGPEPEKAPAKDKLSPQHLNDFDARKILPEPAAWQRVVWPRLAGILAPVLAFGLWWSWRLLRKPVLQRRATRASPQLREVHLSGGVRALLPGLPLRRLAQEMRRRRAIESNELQVEPTIAATLRRLGVFTPVRGSRVEPDYFALVDRASLSDHHALLAGEIVADLARADVLIERYDFDGDATFCRPRDSQARPRLRPLPVPGRSWQPNSVALAELRIRYPDHRVLVFSDGAGCFDSFTGQPKPWVAILAEWQSPVLITPQPPDRWGIREWALQQLGVEVLPLTQKGIATLIGFVGGEPSERTIPDVEAKRPLHERSARRWLDREPPSPDLIDELCAALETEFKERGFAWIAACAAYPEIHWGITLRLGVAIVPDVRTREELLTRVARLVWFREAFMPDWLREALLERLEPEDEDRLRQTLQILLESVAKGAGQEIPLRIATDPPASEQTLWGRARKWLRSKGRWRRVRELLRTAGDDSPLRDHVFLSFMTGQSKRRVDLSAPGGLLKLLRTGPRSLLVPAVGGGTIAFAAAAILAWLYPPYDFSTYAVATSRVEFSADGTRATVVARGILTDISGGGRTVEQAVAELRNWDEKELEWDTTRARGTDLIANGRRYLALTADGSLALGTIGSQDAPQPLDESRGSIVNALNADGSQAAAGFQDGLVLVWRAGSAKPAQRMSAHTFRTPSPVTLLAFSPDGYSLLTGSTTGGVALWDSVTGAVRFTLLLGSVRAAAFSTNGERIAVVAERDGAAYWHAFDARIGLGVRLEAPRVESLNALALSPDGALLALADGHSVALFDLQSAKALGALAHDDAVKDLVFGPSGSLLATIDARGTTRLWDVKTGLPAADPLPPIEVLPASGSVAFSPDGRTLGIAGGAKVSLWSVPELQKGVPQMELPPENGGNQSVRPRRPLPNPPLPSPPAAALPVIEALTADPTVIASGGETRVCWQVRDARRISLYSRPVPSGGYASVVGNAKEKDCTVVRPAASTEYVLLASADAEGNLSNSIRRTALVEVTDAASSAPPVTVPNVVGTWPTEARQTLEKLGLRVTISDDPDPSNPSEGPPAVVGQSPAAGARSPAGGTVTLKLGEGRYVVHGRLVYADGKPATDVRVILKGRGDYSLGTESNGEFRVKTLPGKHLLRIEAGTGTVELERQIDVVPVYAVEVNNLGTITLSRDAVPPRASPRIELFTVRPGAIRPGEKTELCWGASANELSLEINPLEGKGPQSMALKGSKGCMSFTAESTTYYTLTVVNRDGATDKRTVTLTVRAAAAAKGWCCLRDRSSGGQQQAQQQRPSLGQILEMEEKECLGRGGVFAKTADEASNICGNGAYQEAQPGESKK